MLGTGGVIAASHRPSGPSIGGDRSLQFEVGRTLDEIEKEYVLETLKILNNDRKRAAQSLGISVRTLYNWLSESKRATAVL